MFKRDSFTCQYCGRKSPDVVLVVDHIKPVAAGGKNDILNLVSSCFDCNSGKGKTHLSDDCVVNKQRQQVLKIAERRRQIEMFLEWRDSLMENENELAEKLKSEIERILWRNQFTGNAYMLDCCRSMIRKHGFDQCHKAIDSAQPYIKWNDEKITHESSDTAFKKIERIAYWNKVYEDNPSALIVNRAVAYITKVFDGCVNRRVLRSNVETAVEWGLDFDRIAPLVRASASFNNFIDLLQEATCDLS